MKWLLNIILVIVALIISWQFTNHETVTDLIYFLFGAVVAYIIIMVVFAVIGIDIDPFEEKW